MRMRDEVATGQRLQRAMESTGLFPNMVIQMIAVGEESGSLDSMSSKVATHPPPFIGCSRTRIARPPSDTMIFEPDLPSPTLTSNR